MRVQYPKLPNLLSVFTASKVSKFYISFVTKAGVVSCGSPEKHPLISSIMQIIIFFCCIEIIRKFKVFRIVRYLRNRSALAVNC